MDEMENKLNSILSDPDMMGKIMSLAQNLGLSDQQNQQEASQTSAGIPDIDVSTLQKLSGFARQSGIDKNQQSLLHSLRPYLSRQRIAKLEKAMRAAKMANMASGFLGSAKSR